MFFFKNKHTATPDYSALGIDIHSHLLPGIDDGSPDLDTSLSLIRGLQELGFERLITTPHVMGDMYPNTPGIIQGRLSEVNGRMAEEGFSFELQAAAEYFLDDQLAPQIEASTPLLSFCGNHVLCEFSMMSPTMGIKEMIFQLQMQGYRVVIAHPERYIYLEANKRFYEELKDMGCLFQLNLLSLGPAYGKTVQSLCQYLLKNKFYDLAATDLHNLHHLQLLRDPKLMEGLNRLMDVCPVRNRELLA